MRRRPLHFILGPTDPQLRGSLFAIHSLSQQSLHIHPLLLLEWRLKTLEVIGALTF
jgi:hypothetical protein